MTLKQKLLQRRFVSPQHITDAALRGAHIATTPFNVLKQLFNHPLTDQGIEAFLADWESRKNK